MAFAIINRGFLRTSKEILERSMAVSNVAILHYFMDVEANVSLKMLLLATVGHKCIFTILHK